jgi:hypothetical protein
MNRSAKFFSGQLSPRFVPNDPRVPRKSLGHMCPAEPNGGKKATAVTTPPAPHDSCRMPP